jgi:uncharacterized protein YbaP (TraB family)
MDAKDSADAVVFEADFDKSQPPPPVAQQRRLSLSRPAIWRQVTALGASLKLGEDYMDDVAQQEPFFIMQKLLSPLLSREGISFSSGIDANLFGQCKADKNPVLPLEAYSEFYALLAAAELVDDGNSLLEDFLGDPLAAVRRTVQLVDAWRACDLDGLERITNGTGKDSPPVPNSISSSASPVASAAAVLY